MCDYYTPLLVYSMCGACIFVCMSRTTMNPERCVYVYALKNTYVCVCGRRDSDSVDTAEAPPPPSLSFCVCVDVITVLS